MVRGVAECIVLSAVVQSLYWDTEVPQLYIRVKHGSRESVCILRGLHC